MLPPCFPPTAGKPQLGSFLSQSERSAACLLVGLGFFLFVSEFQPAWARGLCGSTSCTMLEAVSGSHFPSPPGTGFSAMF